MMELGFQTPIVCEIPEFQSQRFWIPQAKLLIRDSGFHEQNFSDSGIRIPLHGAIFSWGYTKGLGTTELTYGTFRRHVTRLQPGANDSAQDLQHFTSNDVNTHDIRPDVRCRLRNEVIGFCVESFLEKVDLLLPLCLQRQCTSVTAFSQTSSFLEPRIFKSLKSHKPVCKT